MEAPQHRTHDGKRDWFGLFTGFRHPSSKQQQQHERSLSSTPSPDSGRDFALGLRPASSDCGDDEKLDDLIKHRSWSTIQPSGVRPDPRCDHAATIIGRKMVVVGGESGNHKFNDVHILHLGDLAWSQPRTVSNELPPCKGHSLISWGKTVLLVGGDMSFHSEKVTVWSFDLETERWTKVLAKGDIPAARSGQSVTRAGSILILFGGEDTKGRKLNDLHVLDLKALMWLPLRTMGKGPSPRSKHVAAMYDDRYLLVFGGASKSKVLNDLYALDFDTMMWSRIKPGGLTPSPRSGGAGVVVNDKWYICGGAHKGIRVSETITLDIPRMTWVSVISNSLDSVASNQHFTLVVVQKKDRTFLVAFGGFGTRSYTNEVQVLYIPSADQKNQPTEEFAESVPKEPLVNPPEHPHVLAPRMDSPSPDAVPGLVPLRQIHALTYQSGDRSPEEAHSKDLDCHAGEEDEKEDSGTVLNDQSSQTDNQQEECHTDSQSDRETDIATELIEKLAVAVKRAELTEAQLETVQKDKEETEQKLSVAIGGQHVAEAKLNAAMTEVEELKTKLEASEVIQEESNSLSNIVHSENLRLEHDLSFLKAVLEDTQKELHSMRGVLASERSRAFQLQVELFELKQKSH